MGKSHGVTVPPDFSEIFATVDTDGSGRLDYTEFIAATLSRKQYLREEVLWGLFRTFDLDGDGKIQRNEFEAVVMMTEQADIKSIFDETDLDGDGQIDFLEFCAMMREGTGNSPEPCRRYSSMDSREPFHRYSSMDSRS